MLIVELDGGLYTVDVTESFSDGSIVGRVRMGEAGADYGIGEEVMVEASEIVRR